MLAKLFFFLLGAIAMLGLVIFAAKRLLARRPLRRIADGRGGRATTGPCGGFDGADGGCGGGGD